MNRKNVGVVAAILVLVITTGAVGQNNTLVNVSSGGQQTILDSYYSVLSNDGRFVAFQSVSGNLAPGDFNGRWDVFIRDVQAETTELVSVNSGGNGSGNGLGLAPAISGDGGYVVFESNASNLVPGDTNGTWDVFERDVVAGTTTRVSLDEHGAQVFQRSGDPEISTDGSWIVFSSAAGLVAGDTNGLRDLYRLDRQSGDLVRVSTASDGTQGNGISYSPKVSDDGRLVVFLSSASNLVPADTNNWGDVFLKNIETGECTRINVSSSGQQAYGETIWPTISGDGSTITFNSKAGNLVPGDTNGNWDAFVHDPATGETERFNVRPDGQQADSYVRSPMALTTDGRHVTFASLSTNLVPDDTNGEQDIFVRDLVSDVTVRVNFGYDGSEANDDAWVPDMSADGRFLTITSTATNLVMNDRNDLRDIFLIELAGGCVRDPGWQCDGDVDGDGQVNPVDSGLVQAAFGSFDEQDLCNYDVDCDGQINPVDSGIVQSLFGMCEAPREVCP